MAHSCTGNSSVRAESLLSGISVVSVTFFLMDTPWTSETYIGSETIGKQVIRHTPIHGASRLFGLSGLVLPFALTSFQGSPERLISFFKNCKTETNLTQFLKTSISYGI